LIEYLLSVGADYIYRKQYETEITREIDLKLPLKKPIEVTDRKNSILNKGENFIKTNFLIQYFIGKRIVKVIDISKGKNKLSQLKDRIEKNSKNELLNF
jgi:hypothetical protein